MSAKDLVPEPVSRNLRIFAFDPSISAQVDTADIGEITIAVPWEKDLQPGPIGEYIEVIDADPASNVFYFPVELNDPRILAQNGLPPSETNPQFHQQMVYAVAMATIVHFEQALGRVALWSAHKGPFDEIREFVQRLRIYPHALRDRNAFYSPDKKALLFGYFPVRTRDAFNAPGTLVHTCLSHDIIAHETTHALLEGVHPRFSEPVNADVLAFHEAFADIVALFQHFAYPGVLRDQIAQTRGDLTSEHLLAKLAHQFGRASGRGSALRDFLGTEDALTHSWKPRQPDVRALDGTREPHARGAILVAAVFGAFLKVYRSRTADLFRIASEGTGVLRAGDIHPDLAGRLAAEAASIARYVLQMCIRAIDYCPPVGITFGDYLRAVVTADHDLTPDDAYGFRLAFTESFRQWGIHPAGIGSLSVESLLWPTGQEAVDQARGETRNSAWGGPDPDAMDALFTTEHEVEDKDVETPTGQTYSGKVRFKPWDLDSDRRVAWDGIQTNGNILWKWLVKDEKGRSLAPALGIVLDEAGLPGTCVRSRLGGVAVEVHSVRTAIRRSPRGGTVTDLVVEITQRRAAYLDRDQQAAQDKAGALYSRGGEPTVRPDFEFRTGCTLLVDPVAKEVRRVIRTSGTIDDPDALERVRAFIADGGLEPANAFDGVRRMLKTREPFALLHRDEEE